MSDATLYAWAQSMWATLMQHYAVAAEWELPHLDAQLDRVEALMNQLATA